MGFASSATVAKGNGSVEVALVLDNSGSMAGQPIADLRVAAQNLTSVLYAGYEGTDKVRVGIVPFAGSVNVGSAHQAASWLDSAGLSPTHYENFAEQRTRFQLFTQLGVQWGGCVEVRPSQARMTSAIACLPPACPPACSCPCSHRTNPTTPTPRATPMPTTIYRIPVAVARRRRRPACAATVAAGAPPGRRPRCPQRRPRRAPANMMAPSASLRAGQMLCAIVRRSCR
ncbi:MAG: VWA domain-containing protein [Hyphomicrobiaceae bacterium]|nr:MAG: VWA domain-containing protein [Hyphomicrobiaceae bacterium]